MIKVSLPIAAVAMGLILMMALMMSPSASAAPDGTATDKAADAAISSSSQPAPSTDGGGAGSPATKPGDVDRVSQAKSIWDAFKGGKLREGVAGVLVLLVFFWRRFGAKFLIGKLSTWQVGLVTVIAGLVLTIPEALTMEPFDWKAFVWSGLLTSAEGMLVWKTVGQKVLPKVFGDPVKPDPA
jgi:hypothetical protein